MYSVLRLGIAAAWLLAGCGGGGSGADGGGGDALTGKQTTYAVGGTIDGLGSAFGLSLRLSVSGRADETINIAAGSTRFAFQAQLSSGVSFTVLRAAEPDDRVCGFGGGVNSITRNVVQADISNISLSCTTPAVLSVVGVSTGAGPLAENATDVSLNQQFLLTFSTSLNPTTIDANSITLLTAGIEHPVMTSVVGTTVSVHPVGKLVPGSQYSLSINSLARGEGKERLLATFSRRFETSSGWVYAGEVTDSALTSRMTMSEVPRIVFDAAGVASILWRVAEQGTEVLAPVVTRLHYRKYDTAWGLLICCTRMWR